MDATVTARVPVEVRDQANKLLCSLGYTPTQLINAAYDYVVRHKAYPFEGRTSLDAQERNVTPETLQALEEEWAEMTLALEGVFQDESFRTLKDACYEDRYARLS